MFKVRISIGGVIYLLVCVLQSGCGLPLECRDFNNLPSDRQKTEFRTYPIEKQLDVYLCMMKQEPPTMEFADPIADRGEEAIPYVMARLKKVNSDVEKRDLVYVLRLMSERGYLRGKKDVIDEVKGVICAMKIENMKELSLEYLKKIQINSGPYSPVMSQCLE